MTMVPVTLEGGLAPHEVKLIDDAFKRSWDMLSADGHQRFQGREGYYAREAVAKLVVGLAKRGERDPYVLSKTVVRHMNMC